MTLERFKYVLIIMLVLLSIYQTGRLWFEYNSSRNFFYTFFTPVNAQTRDKTEQMKTLAIPYRKITNFGNRTFAIDYASHNENLDRVITDVLLNGSFIEAEPIDWTKLLHQRSVIYDYAISIATADFSAAFAQRSTNLASRIRHIDAVIIVPKQGFAPDPDVYFVDETAGTAYLYRSNSASLSQAIHTNILDKQVDSEKFFYISTIQNGFSIFEGNQFVPKWVDDIYEYQSIRQSNPYVEGDGEILLYEIEPRIDVFFDNPAYKSEPYPKLSGDPQITGVTEYIYIYLCETSVVKYYPNAVLEYADFRPLDSKNIADFQASYTQAMLFLQKDQEILNDIYLAEYTYYENQNEYIFYYNYAVNNIPIFFNEAFQAETGMSHGIEITVKNNTVTNYKRYTCKFEINEDIAINATVNFSSAIDAIIENNLAHVDTSSTFIQDMLLAYQFEKGKFLSWSWNLDSGDGSYAVPAQ